MTEWPEGPILVKVPATWTPLGKLWSIHGIKYQVWGNVLGLEILGRSLNDHISRQCYAMHPLWIGNERYRDDWRLQARGYQMSLSSTLKP